MQKRSEKAVAGAAELLRRIGATHPDEIDVELVASSFDAHVQWLPLTNEEGHVRTLGDSAFIGVAEELAMELALALHSVMHEIAHRRLHTKEQAALCARDPDELTVAERRQRYFVEREAEDFAAEVLLARVFFDDLLARGRDVPVTLDEIAQIADCLQTSLSATGIRYAELVGEEVTCGMVLTQAKKVEWHAMSEAFRGKIVKGHAVDPRSLAGAMVEGVDRIDGEVRGAWGKRLGVVREQSIRAGDGALTWLWHGRG